MLLKKGQRSVTKQGGELKLHEHLYRRRTFDNRNTLKLTESYHLHLQKGKLSPRIVKLWIQALVTSTLNILGLLAMCWHCAVWVLYLAVAEMSNSYV